MVAYAQIPLIAMAMVSPHTSQGKCIATAEPKKCWSNSCYTRHTLVGREKRMLSRGRYSQRDAASSSINNKERTKSKEVQVFLEQKPIASGLKRTLDCIDQEWEIQYRRQTTYTGGHVSMEHHRTSRNMVSKREHVTDVIDSVRKKEAVHR